MTSTAAEVNPLALAESFTEAERAAIAKYIGVPITDPAFLPMLGIAKHLGLSPILGEIWLVDSERFDRQAGEWINCLRPAVGRDGFLKHARANPRFKALRFGVVCANDAFETEDDGEQVKITHRTKLEGLLKEQGEQVKSSAELEAKYRGAVLGSWAKLFYADDAPPFYYYAPISEHGKKVKSGQDGEEPQEDWAGAWSYTSALIGKCSQSYVLRIGLGISGVVPVDEMPDASALTEGVASRRVRVQEGGSGVAEILERMDITDKTKKLLGTALDRANELSPFSWPIAKVEVTLQGADEEKAKVVLEQLSREIAGLEAGAPAQ